MKQKILIITLTLISFVSCKAPQNALDLASIPKDFLVSNVTDTITKYADQFNNSNTDYYLFETKHTNVYYDVVFVNDTIKSISATKLDKLFGWYSLEMIRYNSYETVHYDDYNPSDFLKYLKESSNIYPVVNHKKGTKFNEILDLYHKTMEEYLQKKYLLFCQDTMNRWTSYEFSISFGNDYSKINQFIETAIGYYNAFPERMNHWPTNVKRNMELLIANFKKNQTELFNLQEFFVEKNDMCSVHLLEMLTYRITKDGNLYRRAQNGLARCLPNETWMYFK